MRLWLGLLHRWFGLFTAAFLFLSGITGAVIAWNHELDGWLNPELYWSRTAGTPRSALELADVLEARDPRVVATYFELEPVPGAAPMFWIEPRTVPSTGEPYELDFDHVVLDPVTGEEQGRRLWGVLAVDRKNLLPFLYKLHFTLHLPEVASLDTGAVFMGIVGIVWTFDAFVAIVLAFPSRAQWRRSFQFRWRDRVRIIFDLHRSGGVWVWALLLVLAVSGVSMNLPQVVDPIVGFFSPLTPSLFDEEPKNEEHVHPTIARRDAVAIATAEALRRGWSDPPGALSYDMHRGTYGVGFFAPGHEHADGRLGNPWITLDGRDGTILEVDAPGEGSAGDVFIDAQFPLHSGRILGFWGRVLVTVLGLAVAMLSVTGVLLWVRRQRWRRRVA